MTLIGSRQKGRKITVKVIPKAGKNSIEETGPDNYVVRISVVPERGKANEAVVKLLAKHLCVAPSLLELVSGSKSRMKIFSIRQLLRTPPLSSPWKGEEEKREMESA